jgi:hypothetical protein
MCDPVSNEELELLLEPIPETEKMLVEDCIGWPVVIDYQTFCSRLISFGFSKATLTQAKAAIIEAELAYRYFGKRKEAKA